MPSNLEIKNSVEQCILRVIQDFQSLPFKFLYESDIQAVLFSSLRANLPDTITVQGTGNPLDCYDVSIVHTEYLHKIDIACLDVELAKNQEKRLHKGVDIHIYELPLSIGIELKYRKIGDVFDIKSCLADFDKLIKFNIPNPIVLGFIQTEADVEPFLQVDKLGFSAIEVDIMSPIENINIISPTRRWNIVKKP